jgi:hypothetical protein
MMAGKKPEDCKTARDERLAKHKELTPKQLHFCRAVAAGATYSDAYREAYNVKPDTKLGSINTSSSKLMADPRIRDRVDVLVRKREAYLTTVAVSDRTSVLQRLRLWSEGEDVPTSAQLKATELLGRTAGMFKDVIDDGRSVSRSPEQIREELELRLQQLANSVPAQDDTAPAEGTTKH